LMASGRPGYLSAQLWRVQPGDRRFRTAPHMPRCVAPLGAVGAQTASGRWPCCNAAPCTCPVSPRSRRPCHNSLGIGVLCRRGAEDSWGMTVSSQMAGARARLSLTSPCSPLATAYGGIRRSDLQRSGMVSLVSSHRIRRLEIDHRSAAGGRHCRGRDDWQTFL
jgi:hypothetical protein